METYRLEYVLLMSVNWVFRNMRRLIGIVAGKDISFCEKVAKFFGERLAPAADLSPLLATSDKFERTSVFTVQPFLLDGSAYVSLTDGRAERMVIALYQGGGRFEDRCYLRAAAQ